MDTFGVVALFDYNTQVSLSHQPNVGNLVRAPLRVLDHAKVRAA